VALRVNVFSVPERNDSVRLSRKIYSINNFDYIFTYFIYLFLILYILYIFISRRFSALEMRYKSMQKIETQKILTQKMQVSRARAHIRDTELCVPLTTPERSDTRVRVSRVQTRQFT